MKRDLGSLLVVDDEPLIRETLSEYLQQDGFRVRTAASGEEALKFLRETTFDVVICDINLPGWDGLEVLDRAQRVSPDTFVVLITAYATVETAIEAFQKGAADYLMKPIVLREVSSKLRRLLAQKSLSLENQSLRRELNRETDLEMIVGQSPAMQSAVAIARKVAATSSTVLILGESGTGKELMARAVHRFASPNAAVNARFVALNCAAIPNELLESQLFGHRKGSFTSADKDQTGLFIHAGAGTLFLDEIGELPLSTQAKLLRAIEQKEVLPVGATEPVKISARIVTATNKHLQDEVDAGRFRGDLFYRLNVVTIRLPPLRERREDIPELIEALIAKHAKTIGKRVRGASREAVQMLSAFPWKGNIRELDNAIQRAIILGDGPLIVPSDLPPDIVPSAHDPSAVDELDEATRRFEKLHIERMLRQVADKREAAKRLGIGLSSLYRKIEQYGIGTSE
jgi:DNA-binding NtrC family response regulator